MTSSTELPIARFKKHKVAYAVAAVVALALAGMFYLIFRGESPALGWFLLSIGLLLSVYCVKNAISNAIVLELSSEGIKYKQYDYNWDRLRSYAIREEDDGEGSYTFLVLNLKNAKVPLEIQLDWIDDAKSVKHHMALFAQAYQVEFEE